ncbi:restriction endonuclease subunit S [Kaistella carnis]|uniref:Restriction endonuclease subunit S n=1 Tax=Kaistella carnis TaxID=1241979 RepID=A0A3G8XMY3_9FLAO|nr:restriction endonuclease subunit S [Kaistella carnis]AZI33893.1 restriction endonuclease subunit S [Kaistella carnis]
MSEWKEYKLDEIADIYNNKRIPLSSIVRSKRQGKYPYYGASGIVDYIDDYIFDGDYILISEDGENLRSRKTPIAFRAQGKFWVNNHAHIIQGKDKFLNNWISYFFKNLNVSPYLTGAVQPKLNKENLLRIPIPIPDFESASIITEVLSSLDDKIELNNNINKELEKLAQTLFKQWFIDFEFPNENGEPYQSSGGEMVESELGMIPKDWEIGILDDILEVKGGTTPSTKDASFWDGIYHWTSPRDLSNLEFPLLIDTDKKITAKGLKKISSGLLPKGTLLLSSRAPIGYLAITEIETAINQGYIAINGKKEFSNIFILYWLKVNMHLVIERANGSTFLEISKTNFKQINCIIPDSTILHQYINQANATFEVMRNNLLENQELSTLRDTLLPKLISGELNVKDL